MDKTRQFTLTQNAPDEMKQVMTSVYEALVEKGYNPINQIVGYILSEDPTYITTHNNARSLIRRIDRDELLQVLVRNYLLNN
ncbi:MAG: IreB family regulatory phosphoprotein [Clostridia bacterium]|nr:IreB family regulatory phosphoprotein [Clostridia bacterium]MBR3554081.1 IreB family regulatory phosphoprotein [Clostridia bacterium]